MNIIGVLIIVILVVILIGFKIFKKEKADWSADEIMKREG